MENMNKHEIGKRIREARKAKGLTIAQLAELVGVQDNYMGQIERGTYIPGFDTFIKILNMLEVTAEYIFEGFDDFMDVEEFPDCEYIPKEVIDLEPEDLRVISSVIEAYSESLLQNKKLLNEKE